MLPLQERRRHDLLRRLDVCTCARRMPSRAFAVVVIEIWLSVARSLQSASLLPLGVACADSRPLHGNLCHLAHKKTWVQGLPALLSKAQVIGMSLKMHALVLPHVDIYLGTILLSSRALGRCSGPCVQCLRNNALSLVTVAHVSASVQLRRQG